MTTRCGCTSACACAIQGNDTTTFDMTVVGVGSVSTPYVVSGDVLLDPGTEEDANLLQVGAGGLEVLCSDVMACATAVVSDSTYISVKSAPYNAVGDVKCMYVSVSVGSDVCHLLGSWPVAVGGLGYPSMFNTIAAFTVDDEGKKFSIPGGGVAGAALHGVFTNYIDATHMQMSLAASTSVASTPGEGFNSNYPSANFGTDDSIAIQAAIDAAYAVIEAGSMAGATVLIPAGSYYVEALQLKTGVRLIGEGMATQLWASPDCGASHVVWLANPQAIAKESAYRFAVESLSIYGQRKGGVTGRCLDLTINSDVFATFQGGGPNDVNATVKDLYTHDCGGDVAVHVGQNVRNSFFSDVRIMNSGHSGMNVVGTDNEFHSLSIGSCGCEELGATATYALKVMRQNNRFVDGKFWYPQNTNGDGVVITNDNNIFVNCETQDNSRYGWTIDSCEGVALTGCLAGGDKEVSLLIRGPATNCRVDLGVVSADRWQTKIGLLLDGTGGPSGFNVIDIQSQPSVLDAAYREIVLQAGALGGSNTIRTRSLQGQQSWFTSASAGNFAPGFPAGGPIGIVLLIGNITVIQVPNVTTTDQVPIGTEVTFIFIQDGTGGRTVAWNAIWGTGIPAVSGVAGAITTIKFVAYAGTPAAPSWQHL